MCISQEQLALISRIRFNQPLNFDEIRLRHRAQSFGTRRCAMHSSVHIYLGPIQN